MLASDRLRVRPNRAGRLSAAACCTVVACLAGLTSRGIELACQAAVGSAWAKGNTGRRHAALSELAPELAETFPAVHCLHAVAPTMSLYVPGGQGLLSVDTVDNALLL